MSQLRYGQAQAEEVVLRGRRADWGHPVIRPRRASHRTAMRNGQNPRQDIPPGADVGV